MIRARRLAGLVALIALALSWAEALRASVCPPETEAHAAMTPPESTDPCEHGPGSDSAPSDSEDPGSELPCPYSVPGVPTTCIFSIALPAVASAGFADVVHRQHDASAPIATRDLLSADLPFHPPKA
ncbi:MAG: hypothetical protein ACT4O1_01195 [Gemmatimonadota bacterium]